MAEDNEGLTLDAARLFLNPKPKRKSPERYGAVTSLDLERLLAFAEEYPGAALLNAIEKLILRAHIAESAARKGKKVKP